MAFGKDVRDEIWTAAVRLRVFTYKQLSAASNRNVKGINKLVLDWENAGKVARIVDPGERLQFRIVDPEAGEVPPPRRQSPDGNMWNAMRRFASFKPTDLAALATTDQVKVSPEDAATFCRMLAGASYLRVLEKAVPGKREATYRLIRDTGPRPPRQMRITVVFDDNLDVVTHMPKEVA